MPTAIYDSSLLTRRRDDKFATKSFLSRIQPPLPNFPPQNKTQYGPPTGVYDDSILNKLKNGQPAEYRNGVIIDPACIPLLQIPNPPIIPPWIARLVNGSAEVKGSCTVGTNVYIIGSFSGSLTLNSADQLSIISPSMTLTSSGSFDVFIAKYNTNGILQWGTKIGGTNADFGVSICADVSNIYVTGYFSETVTLYSASGLLAPTIPLMSLTSSGASDVFIAKYNTNGQLQWGTQIGGTSNDTGNSICTDGTNIYVTGNFGLTATLFSANGLSVPTTPSMTLTATGFSNIFIAKYNTNGQLQWSTTIEGTSNDTVNSICTDGTNIYVTGYFGPTATLFSANGLSGPTTPSIILTATGVYDVFIAKYNTANGQLQWGTQIGGTPINFGYSICTDGTNIYVTGYFIGTATLYSANLLSPPNPSTPSMTLSNAGGYDIFIAKYNQIGQLQWGTQIGGTISDFSNSICTDGSNIYVTGHFGSTVTLYSANGILAPTIPSMSLTSSGSFDVFITKYSINGQLEWGTQIGGASSDFGNSICTDGSNIYVGGYITDSGSISIFNANGLAAPSLAGTFTNTGQSGYLLKLTTDGKFNNL